MLIFWKERLAFLAVTKTGSTSIEMALESLAQAAILRPPALKHTSAARFRQHLAPFLATASDGGAFETVALIREPIDWLGSWYRYRLREHMPIREAARGDDSFAAFVEGFLANERPTIAGIDTQARFLTDRDGAVAVDHLFQYEQIDRFLDFLEDRIGCEILLPRLNASPEASLLLPSDLESALRDRLAPDFALHAAARRD